MHTHLRHAVFNAFVLQLDSSFSQRDAMMEWRCVWKGDEGESEPGIRSSHAITACGNEIYLFGGERVARVPVDNAVYRLVGAVKSVSGIVCCICLQVLRGALIQHCCCHALPHQVSHNGVVVRHLYAIFHPHCPQLSYATTIRCSQGLLACVCPKRNSIIADFKKRKNHDNTQSQFSFRL